METYRFFFEMSVRDYELDMQGVVAEKIFGTALNTRGRHEMPPEVEAALGGGLQSAYE